MNKEPLQWEDYLKRIDATVSKASRKPSQLPIMGETCTLSTRRGPVPVRAYGFNGMHDAVASPSVYGTDRTVVMDVDGNIIKASYVISETKEEKKYTLRRLQYNGLDIDETDTRAEAIFHDIFP